MTLLIGIIIGTVLGLTGAGGSVFAVPLLMLVLDLPLQQAAGISLGAVAASSLFGTLTHLKSKQIQWAPAAVYAVLGGIFSPLGNQLGQHIPESTLIISFALLVAIIAWRMWHQARKRPEDARVVRAQSHQSTHESSAICKANNMQAFRIGLPCISAISGGAILTGLLSGLFGVGGGFLIIPTLLYLTAISIKQAVATSLVIISIISSTGFISFLASGNELSFNVLSQVAIGGIAGMYIGTLASKRIAGPNLQRIFAALMLIMATVLVLTKLF